MTGVQTCALPISINVALSIGLYLAEHATGPYKDHFITFSSKPKLQNVVGSTITEKINNMYTAQWNMKIGRASCRERV